LTRLSEAYRKIRNTSRFILSNLHDFNPDQDTVEYSRLKRVDKWILQRLYALLERVDQAYNRYEFQKAYKAIYDFCNEELSMYYLDMAKGRLYTFAAVAPERRAVQTALFEIISVLVRLIAPILVFTSEEIWQCMPHRSAEKGIPSVHFAQWPSCSGIYFKKDAAGSAASADDLSVIIGLIPDVAKALEQQRSAGFIGSSFDAKIKLLTNQAIRYTYLKDLERDCEELFKVSSVEVHMVQSFAKGVSGSLYNDIAIEVSKADGVKCERCWNYSGSVGTHKDHPALCERCVQAIGA
jgi:isoleucyl-tRNA synthetase